MYQCISIMTGRPVLVKKKKKIEFVRLTITESPRREVFLCKKKK